MGKRRFKTIKLVFKLMLLFQIYSHHKFEVEAAQNSIPKRCDEGDGTSGLNNQISENEAVDNVLDRPKRPARLIPWRIIRGKEKNQTEIDDVANKRFYGPASSCEELLKIGYTRNGFYLVKGNATSNNNHHVEIVDCLFKHSNGVKEVKEKRLGTIRLKTKQTKFRQRRSVEKLMDSVVDSAGGIDLERSKRPIRLLPHHILYAQDKNDTEDENVSKPFYGPPDNCTELAKLGYTLNGYYLVNGSKSSSIIEVVLCRFQFPPSGVNNTAMEERLGFINLDRIQAIMDKVELPSKKLDAIAERKNRPVRLLPPKHRPQKEENKTVEQNVLVRRNSNPVNCIDIGLLGYTLNGFYLVNSSESAGRFGVSFCQFKLPPGAVRTAKDDLFGFINLLENINKTSDETKSTEKLNNCKKPLEIIKKEKNGTLCMTASRLLPIFATCDGSNTFNQMVILKTEGDRNYNHICIRNHPQIPRLVCLTVVKQTFTGLDYYEQSDQDQHWLMNSTTRQWSSVSYPKKCLTSGPSGQFKFDRTQTFLEKCNEYGYESHNPKLPKYQNFYLEPALDKNGKQRSDE